MTAVAASRGDGLGPIPCPPVRRQDAGPAGRHRQMPGRRGDGEEPALPRGRLASAESLGQGADRAPRGRGSDRAGSDHDGPWGRPLSFGGCFDNDRLAIILVGIVGCSLVHVGTQFAGARDCVSTPQRTTGEARLRGSRPPARSGSMSGCVSPDTTTPCSRSGSGAEYGWRQREEYARVTRLGSQRYMGTTTLLEDEIEPIPVRWLAVSISRVD